MGVGRIHLVGVFVAFTQIAGRPDGIAKRPVKGRSILGGIRQNSRINLLRAIQISTNPGDAPIHHVRRRHNIGAGLRVGERLLR